MDRVLIFDTTLRDGEQSPGATMTQQEKLRVARALDRLGVDVIEAGFPISSPKEFESVRQIARELERPTVAALARAKPGDIDRALEAVADAARPRIHTFLATSDIHLEQKLRIDRAEALRRIDAAVRQAAGEVSDVEFSAEDAIRTDPEFLCEAVRVAVEAGARTINVPDTVGYAHPEDIRRIIAMLRERVPGIEDVVLSIHCHDDLGLATANSLAAVEAGARQIECTVNGIGERAGNASLEEVVMAIRVLPHLRERFETGIATERLCPTSELLAHVTGLRPQANKAVVGANAFAHEAGIHQDGMLKDARTYEIMTPQTVGARSSSLVLGKHSGRAALIDRFTELGFDLTIEETDRAYGLFKLLAETGRPVRDEDLLAIYFGGSMLDVDPTYRLEHLDVRCGRSPSEATVRVSRGGDKAAEASATGAGPIEATYAAIAALLPSDPKLVSFDIHAAGAGRDAVGEVDVQLQIDGYVFHGTGASIDVIDAAARAYLSALDKAAHAERLEEQSFGELEMWAV